MRLVVDANVVLSALIADSTTRELIVTLEPSLLTPEIVHDEIARYEDLVVEKLGMGEDDVRQFIELLFDSIETVPVKQFHTHIEQAEDVIGDTDPNDVLYVACALGCEAGIWSDDTDFETQDLVPLFTTEEVLDTFETR